MTQTQTVLGKYALIKEIGRGGMGVVYQALDQLNHRPVAVKELRLENLSSADAEEMIARFQREARTAGLLQHTGIVSVYDFGQEGHEHYLIMELLEGKTLKDLLSEGYAFSELELLDILVQICDALEFAHQQGVVHRDIKPDNILITPQSQVKIMDFGIARMNTTEHFTLQTQAGTMLGTLSYMSPEQLQDSAMVDHRADIFSLGVMLYEIYTGRLPFEGESMGQTIMNILSQPLAPPQTHNPSLRPELNTLIERMLHKRRGERYQHMSDVAADIQQLRSQIELSEQAGASNLPRPNLLIKRPTGIMRNRLTSETRIGGSYKDHTNQTNPVMGRIQDVLEEEGLENTDQALGLKPHIFNDRPHGITLEVSADWQQAWLNVDPLYALETVTPDILLAFLQRSGLIFGLNQAVLDKAVRQGFLERELVAQGEPVTDGQDAWLEYLLDEIGQGPVENEDGSVDFRQLNILATVPEDTPLLLRHPPIEGKAGKDLSGKIISPRVGVDRRLLEGEGTCRHPDDPNLLVAAIPGHPVKGVQSVRIQNLVQIEEVGVKSGNIQFDGSVIIAGNVHSGYQVEAGGDIIVKGSVEDAVLNAGGNIVIHGSVFGNQNTHIRAKGNIHAHFIQQAQIECQGSLHVREGLFHSQVRTVGPIRVGTQEGKGQINGGQVSSAHLIKARILGSPSSTTTTLYLGVDPIVETRLGDLEEKLKLNKRKLEENIKSLIYLRTQARDQVERQKELEVERTRLMIEGNTLTDEVQFLKEQVKLSGQPQQCRILALNQIYAGVRFNFSGAMRTLDSDQPGPLQARCLQKNTREREVSLEFCSERNLDD
jgi:uncharacterized protein (DUF342 family)